MNLRVNIVHLITSMYKQSDKSQEIQSIHLMTIINFNCMNVIEISEKIRGISTSQKMMINFKMQTFPVKISNF